MRRSTKSNKLKTILRYLTVNYTLTAANVAKHKDLLRRQELAFLLAKVHNICLHTNIEFQEKKTINLIYASIKINIK